MTNTHNHTTAPWVIFSNHSVAHIFGAEGGGALFTHHYQTNDEGDPYENFDEVDANFRLVAAAPELLEALELALQHLIYDGKHPAVIAAKAAIARAKGAA